MGKLGHFCRRGADVVVLVLLLATPWASGQAASSYGQIRDSKQLVVGVDVPYGKMEFYAADGSLAGIDIDVARHIAEALELQPKFEVMAFSELFSALKAGRIDLVISAVTITSERQQTMRFSVPYFDAALQIAVRKADSGITELEHLSGKRVGVLKGTVGESFVRKSDLVDNDKIVVFDANPARINALKDGQVDAIVMHFSLNDHPTLRTLDKPLSQSYYGVVGRLQDEALMGDVNRALRDLKRTGELSDLKRKYLD